MNAPTERLANLIQSTAQSLWDVGSTILATGYATADDWELARAAASHLVLALQQPPAPAPHLALQSLNAVQSSHHETHQPKTHHGNRPTAPVAG